MTLTDIRGDQSAFARQCSSKRAYGDERLVDKVINIAKYERDVILRKYVCNHCGCWHLTKMDKI